MSIPDLPPPNKRLGQNFLIDPNIVRKIVALAELQPSDHVLEIGPGRGILTEALSRAAGCVTAIEVDSRLQSGRSSWLTYPTTFQLRCSFDYSTSGAGFPAWCSCCRPKWRIVSWQNQEARTMVCSRSWRSTQPRSLNRFVSQPSVSVPGQKSPRR
ncbi:MAG: hypothetical protein E8D50_11260 [Nitrospira sp.]|nr:MAG: hypothetical protein E8D50_11260 [Nitrospira sp.]